MSRDENLSNTKRRISTKYPKTKDVHYRYGDFQEKCLNKYRIDNDLDVGTKTSTLLDGILSKWFEMETIKEFQREDPDLMIKMKREEDKQQWIDFLYDCCDEGEIRVLRSACDALKEYGSRVVSKIKNK